MPPPRAVPPMESARASAMSGEGSSFRGSSLRGGMEDSREFEPDIAVTPESGVVTFGDIAPSREYEQFISVRNLSAQSVRVRFIPPKTNAFKISRVTMPPIAPGLAVRVKISFKSTGSTRSDLSNCYDQITVCSELSCIEVQLRALVPRADVHFNPVVDFGIVNPPKTGQKTVCFRNKGAIKAHYSFKFENSLPLRVFPSSGVIGQRGTKKDHINVEFEFMGDTPGLFRAPVYFHVEGQEPVAVDLSAQVFHSGLEVVWPDTHGGSVSEVLFKSLYYGERQTIPVRIVNNSSEAITFAAHDIGPAISRVAANAREAQRIASRSSDTDRRSSLSSTSTSDRSDNQDDAPEEEEEVASPLDDTNEIRAMDIHNIFSVSPDHGQLAPFGSAVVQILFHPPRQRLRGFKSQTFGVGRDSRLSGTLGRTPSGIGMKRPESAQSEAISMLSIKAANYKHQLEIHVLETGQRSYLDVQGCAQPPLVDVSETHFRFGHCATSDFRDYVFDLTNRSEELPVTFKISRKAGFRAEPSEGSLLPLQSKSIVMRFHPNQLGDYEESLNVDVCNGVLKIPLRVYGSASSIGDKKSLTATKNLTATGEPVRKFVDPYEVSRQEQEIESSKLLKIRKRGADLLAATVGDDVSVTSIADSQLAAAREEFLEKTAHRQIYDEYLKSMREQGERRRANETALRTKKYIDNPADLGMEPASGLQEPEPGLVNTVDPLYLKEPVDGMPSLQEYVRKREARAAGRNPHANRQRQLDPTRPVSMQFKPEPTSQMEINDCHKELSTKDLLSVQCGPKVLDFGKVSLFSMNKLTFHVVNDLQQFIWVELLMDSREGLEQTPCISQVIPGAAAAGFEIRLCIQSEPQHLKQTLHYTINKVHRMSFIVVAEVVPVELHLDRSDMVIRVPEYNLDPTYHDTVTITNMGNAEAEYVWELVDTTSARSRRGESSGEGDDVGAVERIDSKGSVPSAVSSPRSPHSTTTDGSMLDLGRQLHPPFTLEPEQGMIAPHGSENVKVTLHPGRIPSIEQKWQLVVKGGPPRDLNLTGVIPEGKCRMMERSVDLGLIAVGLPNERLIHIRNTGQSAAVFNFKNLPPGVKSSFTKGCISVKDEQEIRLNICPEEPGVVDTKLVVNVRGGKDLRLPVTYEARIPSVELDMEDINFGAVYVGSQKIVMVTVKNVGPLMATLYLDLEQYQEFSIDLEQFLRNRGVKSPTLDAADNPIQIESSADAESSIASDDDDDGSDDDMSEMNGGMDDMDGMTSDEFNLGYRYRITVPVGEVLEFPLIYSPMSIDEFEFGFPLSLAGIDESHSEHLHVPLCAEGRPALVMITPTVVDFSKRVVFREGTSKLPHTTEIQIQNETNEDVRWTLGDLPEELDAVFRVEPSRGALLGGESSTIRVTFMPREALHYVVRLPLELYMEDMDSEHYMDLEIRGEGIYPQLTFDRKEVILPVVPLGVPSCASFIIINEGYDHLDVRHRLPSDTEKIPLELTFPGGTMVSRNRTECLVEVTFVSNDRPCSFSASIDFFDSEGTRFSIPVIGIADNSLLTVYPFISMNRESYYIGHGKRASDKIEATSVHSDPFMLLQRQKVGIDDALGDDGDFGETETVFSWGVASQSEASTTIDRRSERLRRRVFSRRSVDRLRRYLNSALLPAPCDDIVNTVLESNGRVMFDILANVAGKRPPGFVDKLSPMPNEAAMQLYTQYEHLMVFLKSYGAMLTNVKPELLLRYDDYQRICTIWDERRRDIKGRLGSVPVTRHIISADDTRTTEALASTVPFSATMYRKQRVSERRFRYWAIESWMTIFHQVIRVFMLSRVNLKSLQRAVAGLGVDVTQVVPKKTGLGSSNVYTVSESILLRWLTFHYRRVIEKKFGLTATDEEPEAEKDSNAPSSGRRGAPTGGRKPSLPGIKLGALASRRSDASSADDGAKSSARSGFSTVPSEAPEPVLPDSWKRRLTNFDIDFQDGTVLAALIESHVPWVASRFETLKWRCESLSDRQHNCGLVVAALKDLGLDYTVYERDLVRNTDARDTVMLMTYLFGLLPQYLPKTTIVFEGHLRECITKTIELTNPSRHVIEYVVLLRGASGFSVAQDTVRLEPGQTFNFPVEVTPRFSKPVSSYLIFLGRRVGAYRASTMVFGLQTQVKQVEDSMDDLTSKISKQGAKALTGANDTLNVSHSIESMLYSHKPLEISVTCPFGTVPGRFAVRVIEKRIGSDSKRKKQEDDAIVTPPAFYCTHDRISFKRDEKAKITLHFIPFQLGLFFCRVVFVEENAGEFFVDVRAVAKLPSPESSFHVSGEEFGSTVKDVDVPMKNMALERARTLVQSKYSKAVYDYQHVVVPETEEPVEKDRATMPLKRIATALTAMLSIRPQQKFKVESLSPFFILPNTFVAREARKQMLKQQSSADNDDEEPTAKKDSKPKKSTSGEIVASAIDPVNTMVSCGKMLLEFRPQAPGSYRGKCIMRSGMDIRVYELVGRAQPKAKEVELEFEAPVRDSVVQELPFINTTDENWSLHCEMNGGDSAFSTPAIFDIPSKETKNLPLTFCPRSMGVLTAVLTVKNDLTGESTVYKLSGTALEPGPEDHVTVECKARQQVEVPVSVRNRSQRSLNFKVETDLSFVSGPPAIQVPAGACKDYVLTVCPPVAGVFQGSLTFKHSDGDYQWFAVEVLAERSPPEKTIELRTTVREPVVAEIEISNPLNRIVEFDVQFGGDGVVGDRNVQLSAGENYVYQLAYAPLRSGNTVGYVSFVNDELGDFWYELKLHAYPAPAIKLDAVECAIGDRFVHEVLVENPSEEALEMICESTLPTVFTPQQSRIRVEPFETTTLQITYCPASIGVLEQAEVRVFHPAVGEWVYLCEGRGKRPADMPRLKSVCDCTQTKTIVVTFRNPFPVGRKYDVALETERQSKGIFHLLVQRPRITLTANATISIPVSFTPLVPLDYHASVVIREVTENADPLTWRFPLVGIGETTIHDSTLNIKCASRSRVERVAELLPEGIEPFSGEVKFTHELVVPEKHRQLLLRALTFTAVDMVMKSEKTPLLAKILFVPLKPIRVTVDLLLKREGGGQWRFPVVFDASEPEPDSVITLEAAAGSSATAQFQLNNIFAAPAPFKAYLSLDCPPEFSIHPVRGSLSPYGYAPSVFTVKFDCRSYGKPLRGRVYVETDDMLWRYDLRGTHPQYVVPQGESIVRKDFRQMEISDNVNADNAGVSSSARSRGTMSVRSMRSGRSTASSRGSVQRSVGRM